MGDVMIGVDIGQKRDPTAIAVAEREWRRRNDLRDDHYLIRYLQRLPLGTPYPTVAERLEEIVTDVRKHARSGPSVYVDATGVGQPVVDLLEAVETPIYAVYFTHGDRRSVNRRQITLGKAWLVSRLQALLQTGRIHLPRTEEADVLANELLDYELRVSENANDTYGAFKVGSHDDLVTALGLAVQAKPQPRPRVHLIHARSE